jgi:hypothetical protein
MNPRSRRPSTDDEDAEPATVEVMRFDFQVEFSWQPKMPGAEGEETAGADVPAAQPMMDAQGME